MPSYRGVKGAYHEIFFSRFFIGQLYTNLHIQYKFDGISFFSSSLSKNQVVEEEEESTYYRNKKSLKKFCVSVPLMAYSGGFWPIRGVKRKYAKRK